MTLKWIAPEPEPEEESERKLRQAYELIKPLLLEILAGEDAEAKEEMDAATD